MAAAARFVAALAIAACLVASASAQQSEAKNTVTLSRKIETTAKNMPFIPKPNYLMQNLDFQYAEELFNQLTAIYTGPGTLQNRGEAHVTIITPPEYEVLKDYVPIGEINNMARSAQYNVQNIGFKIRCLGYDHVGTGADMKVVYNIVIEGQGFINIRQAIFSRFYKRGGNGCLFDPKAFWGHITIAFNVGDLFLQDGVYKGANSCDPDTYLETTP